MEICQQFLWFSEGIEVKNFIGSFGRCCKNSLDNKLEI
jgi:hypothetical protein